MNANLVHKFPITDEEYNPVEEGVLNVKQRVGNSLPSSQSVGMQQNWLVGLTEAPMKLAISG